MTQAGVESGVVLLRPCPALWEMEQMLMTTRSRSVQQIFNDREKTLAENKAMVRRRTSPHNPLHADLADGAWAGEPCFVIGGGPSLVGFDFERLRGRGRVIAINRAFEFIPWADMLFFMDWNFYKLYHNGTSKVGEWNSFKGYKVFLNLIGRLLEDCYSVRSLGRSGVSRSHEEGLYHGNNSGFGALQLAACLGARPIYLLGYDMGESETGLAHFHSGYGKRERPTVSKSFVRDFELVAVQLKKIPDIYNLNPKSGLRIFPFKSVEEVLNGSAREVLGNDPHPVRESVLLDSPASN